MFNMYYVYKIQSLADNNRIYTGYTEDVYARLEAHNSGQSKHTSKYKPWKLVCFTAFENKQSAKAFESYLKTGSGRAFSKKHLQ